MVKTAQLQTFPGAAAGAQVALGMSEQPILGLGRTSRQTVINHVAEPDRTFDVSSVLPYQEGC